jgi:transcription-repair coupling factor (superfamily II helicase)
MLWIAREFREGAGLFLVLCPDDASARVREREFRTFVALTSKSEAQTAVLPTWERSPYSPIAPSLKTRLERAAALHLLHQPKSARAVFASVGSILQWTLSPPRLEQTTWVFRRGAQIEDRNSLARKLQEAGYSQLDPVQDSGSFCFRGDLIDLFPPSATEPFRIELFDTEIERIRSFNPESQRTTGKELEEISFGPARESFFTLSESQKFREKVKALADELGVSKKIRDPVLDNISAGIYPDHSEYWLSLIEENRSCVDDYLKPDSLVFWVDEMGSLSQWKNQTELLAHSREKFKNSDLIVPPLEDIFCLTPTRLKKLQQRTSLYFDTLESRVDSLPLKVEPNTLKQEAYSEQIRRFIEDGFSVSVFANSTSQIERIKFLLRERGIPVLTGQPPSPGSVTLHRGGIEQGFTVNEERWILIDESELFARSTREKTESSKASEWSGLKSLDDLRVGDTIVHLEHGLGRYLGLRRMGSGGSASDFLQIEYANNDKLYLPIYRLNSVQKYMGGSESVSLNRLGTAQFEKTKAKVRESVRALAFSLVELYAQRKIEKGIPIDSRGIAYREFEASFPFEETPDQNRAIEDCFCDLESGKLMDRLVCGDVGFGKTEVAVRVTYQTVMSGKQVAVLVPTTVLCFQHELTFKSRLSAYGIRVESLSRFKTTAEQKKILKDLSLGKIDVLIGTHRLLSSDVKFKDLALMVVDEEHRFGVEHKEKLKTIRSSLHVLTLTATPIPRTLQMTVTGLRDISLIATPPVDRVPIRTFVSKFDIEIVRSAIETELMRGGQVFFLHNRVQSIYDIAEQISKEVSLARVIVAHGQMNEGELEKAMLSFYEKQGNVLVCTTIIESGLDIPSANTILIDRADRLGLAQLYQIRGRVGRGDQRAFAYLFISEEGSLSSDARRRLEVIQRFVELGSGFQIASHDLEIRGGGNVLGPEQSGHVAAVGFDLYTELLEEAVLELQGKPRKVEDRKREPEIKVPYAAYLPESFVPDLTQRLSLYRKLSAADHPTELEQLEDEIRDRYGELPEQAVNLLWILRLKEVLRRHGIDALTLGSERISLQVGASAHLDPVKALERMRQYPDDFQITPDSRVIARIDQTSLPLLAGGVEKLLIELSVGLPSP